MAEIRNPELLRYLRSELRTSRLVVTLVGALAGALLMALFVLTNSDKSQLESAVYWRNVHAAILTASSMILVLWSLLNASQAIVSERTHRTFDFWRTTRLSPLTLAIGKLLGAPLLAWLQFATVLPVLLFTGLLAGYSLAVTLGSLLVIAVFNLALSAVALCASMRAPDARRANLMMLAILIGIFVSFAGGAPSGGYAPAASAWTALTPAPAIGLMLDARPGPVMLFDRIVPPLPVTLVLSLVVLAWCLVALVRCIKFEPDERSLFSPMQVVGASATVLLFVYAAFRPTAESPSLNSDMASHFTLVDLLATGVSAGMACLYFTINSTLLTRDNLRQELRTRVSWQILMRIISPWLATGGIALVGAVVALLGYAPTYARESPNWFAVLVTYVSVALYAARDGLFLQWMISQRVKAPVLKGSVLLGCYYLAASTVSVLFAGPVHMGEMFRWLAPPVAHPGQLPPGPAWLAIAGFIPPIATAALISVGIFHKMRQSQQAAVLAEA
jgi:hypothetical protein